MCQSWSLWHTVDIHPCMCISTSKVESSHHNNFLKPSKTLQYMIPTLVGQAVLRECMPYLLIIAHALWPPSLTFNEPKCVK